MKVHEQLVTTYLTQIEGCAVMPQLQVHGMSGGGGAGPLHSESLAEPRRGPAPPQPGSERVDLLAIDFATRSVQVIAVSESRKLEKAAQLARVLVPVHRTALEHAIRESVLHGALADWEVRWRFFVRAGLADVLRCEEAYGAYRDRRGAEADVTTLEHVFNTVRDRLERLH